VFTHFGQWFHEIQDVLFAVEFVLVQLYLIWHLIKALFLKRE